jgi:hypothetical protein
MIMRKRANLERALVQALLESLDEAVESIVVAFRGSLRALLDGYELELDAHAADVRASAERAVAALPARGPLGRVKSCTICGLPGTRNSASLPASHTREEHRRHWEGARARADLSRTPPRGRAGHAPDIAPAAALAERVPLGLRRARLRAAAGDGGTGR